MANLQGPRIAFCPDGRYGKFVSANLRLRGNAMVKKLVIAAGIVVVALVVGVIALLLSINYLFKKGVDYGATYALGVPTTIQGADVGVFAGRCTINGLRVANPEGFPGDHFLTLGQCDVAVNLGSLLKPVVEVPRLELKDIDMVLEKREGKANYQVILDNLKGSEQAPPAEEKEGKKFIIRDLTVRNVAVTVDLLPVGGQLSRQRIVVPEIRLQNVGAEESRGVVMSKLTKVVVQAIFESLMGQGVELPGEVLAQLQQGMGQLEPLGKYGMQVVGDVQSQVTELGKGVGQAVGEAGKQLERVGKGLGGLLGGKKETQTTPEPVPQP